MSKDKIAGLGGIQELLFGKVIYGNEKNPKKKSRKEKKQFKKQL